MDLIHDKYPINILYSDAVCQAPEEGEDTFVRS